MRAHTFSRLDNVKLILICGVVIGHGFLAMTGVLPYPIALSGYNGVPYTFKSWILPFYLIVVCLGKSVAVPNFFFISGVSSSPLLLAA